MIFPEALAAVATAVSSTDTASIDWHEVAVVCGAIITLLLTMVAAICGWVWVSTMGWLRKISELFNAHVVDDNKAFAEVKQMINDRHIDIINTINRARVSRFDDDRAPR